MNVNESLHIKTDTDLDVGKRLYLNRETNKNMYIGGSSGGFNRLSIRNDDPSGDISFVINAVSRVEISDNDMLLGPSITLTGEVVDTSSEKVKYDIKEADYDFTNIVKKIIPKTFKMKQEKELDIDKTHISFTAENIEEILPNDIQNIILDKKNVKRLNYLKLNAILWGCVRQQQEKIEHLEASVYELQEAMKALKKPKAKAKTKVEK